MHTNAYFRACFICFEDDIPIMYICVFKRMNRLIYENIIKLTCDNQSC